MCVYCILINFCLPPGSVLTGVGYGIRRISEICFSAGMFINLSLFFLFSFNLFMFLSSFFPPGMFLMLTILLLDNTVYLLNLYVQSMGFYAQNLLQVSSHKFSFSLFSFFLRFSFAPIQLLIFLKQHFFLFIFSLFSQAFILLKE